MIRDYSFEIVGLQEGGEGDLTKEFGVNRLIRRQKIYHLSLLLFVQIWLLIYLLIFQNIIELSVLIDKWVSHSRVVQALPGKRFELIYDLIFLGQLKVQLPYLFLDVVHHFKLRLLLNLILTLMRRNFGFVLRNQNIVLIDIIILSLSSFRPLHQHLILLFKSIIPDTLLL